MLGYKHILLCESGIKTIIENLSTRLVKQGHELTCCNHNDHHVSRKHFDREGIN